MRNNAHGVMNQFLPDSFYDSYLSQPNPMDVLGWVTYSRTYAQRLGDRLEKWPETLKRCVEAVVKLGCPYTQDDAMKIYDHQFNLRAFFSGRAFWQLGRPTVERLGGASINNCYMSVCDTLRVFSFAMDMLMLGGGVGLNVQRQYTRQLPRVRALPKIYHVQEDADYDVEDSREGWIKLVEKTFEAFFVTGRGFTYSTRLLRPKGSPIKGFGGRSSGPGPLIEGITKISELLRSVYLDRAGILGSVSCADLLCIIGQIVVSGNVRRSALIVIGDPDDSEYLKAKSDLSSAPPYRSMANYSVAVDNIDELPEEFWNGYNGQGEPYGLINFRLARICGLVGDFYYSDTGVNSVNPCAEITGAATPGIGEGESCNLATITLSRTRTYKEFREISNLLYWYLKTVSNMPYHWPDLERVVHRNNRLGMSVSGVWDFVKRHGENTLQNYLFEGYQGLRSLDNGQIKYPHSIKMTAVQPDGTKSLMSGASPGAHAHYAKYAIRRMRLAADDPLVPILAMANYNVEPAINLNTVDPNTVVVDFPIHRPNSVYGDELTAIQQLEMVSLLQGAWADNSVSATVYYKQEELPKIKDWLRKNYSHSIKTVSFLMYTGHGFLQAPYEPISEERYVELSQALGKIDMNQEIPYVENIEIDDTPGCEKGVCPPR